MKYRPIKFPGHADWHIQLSERPVIIVDARSAVMGGEEIFCLRKSFPTSDEAEQEIRSIIRNGGAGECGEWIDERGSTE